MCSYRHVLLASHGTPGAQAAERYAIAHCTEALHHLIAAPDFWADMMGDDWLNNASVRHEYGNYLEKELAREIKSNIVRVARAASGLRYTCQIVVGRPDTELVKAASRHPYDLVVLGSSRPRGICGLRSRMLTPKLGRSLRAPLVVAPYPLFS